MSVKNFTDMIDWYDRNAKEYADATYRHAPDDLINQFVNLLPNNPTILDAGCGAGRDTGLFFAKGADVTGLDISQGLLQEARKRNPGLTFVHGNFLDIPFKDNFFDGVWAHAALVHVTSTKEAEKSLKEFHRVLKNKGILHIYVKEKAQVEVKNTNFDKKRYFSYFSEDEIKQYVQNAGFTIKETSLHKSSSRTGLRWICLFAEK